MASLIKPCAVILARRVYICNSAKMGLWATTLNLIQERIMLNMISSLASLSQTLRTSHSKPTAADSSTHTPQSSPSASTASISEQGQAMLVQSRMATQQNATAEQARLAEEARAQFAVPKWLAEMNPAPYLNAELGGSEWSGTQNSPEKMSWCVLVKFFRTPR